MAAVSPEKAATAAVVEIGKLNLSRVQQDYGGGNVLGRKRQSYAIARALPKAVVKKWEKSAGARTTEAPVN